MNFLDSVSKRKFYTKRNTVFEEENDKILKKYPDMSKLVDFANSSDLTISKDSPDSNTEKSKFCFLKGSHLTSTYNKRIVFCVDVYNDGLVVLTFNDKRIKVKSLDSVIDYLKPKFEIEDNLKSDEEKLKKDNDRNYDEEF